MWRGFRMMKLTGEGRAGIQMVLLTKQRVNNRRVISNLLPSDLRSGSLPTVQTTTPWNSSNCINGLQRQALQQCYDSLLADHQEFDKALELLCIEAYWVNMISDVESYCHQCHKCQQSKLPLLSQVPLKSIAIGNGSVPFSINANKCLIVCKTVLPLPKLLLSQKHLSCLPPWTYLRLCTWSRVRTLKVMCSNRSLIDLGYRSHILLPTIHKAMAWNCSLLQLLSTYII